jgi:hypothetical protein
VLATGAVHATVNDSATGNSNIAAAEYFVDVVGAAGTGVVMTATDAAFDSPLEGVDATIPPAVLAALLTGNHPVYVRGRDAAGNWGPVAAANLAVDVTGPSTSALSASPATTNGSAPVALNASGSDLGTGNANVVGAEYFIDVPVVNGSGTALTVSPVATTVSITGSIPAAAITPLAAGPHTIRVHALDSNGNWGTAAMATLTVDTVGPVTSTVVASPNPSNGAIGFNASVPAVRVTALTADASSNVVAAEGFIDTVGAVGTGFVLSPVDGIWNSPSESVRADIPLSTVVLLTNGTHTISVRGKDATGTWGAPTVINFVVDKVAPTVTGVATVAGPNTLTLSANVADTLTGLNRVEYFVDTDPGRGLATVMTAGAPPVYTAAIPTLLLSEGAHTVTVRAGDGAGNWTTAATINVTVNRTLAFSTAGNTNPPTVGGAADDADIYQYNGTFTRAVDVTTIANPVPAGANVDGLVRIDNTHFYLSFTDNTTTLPGLGAVQDEDIVFYNAGTWSVYFDGTSHGLGASNNQDIDAFDIVGTTIYFSTVGNTNPTGVTGTADDADIYSWNGTALARVWDASTHNVPGGGNVDGLSFVDSTHLFVSFGDNVTLSGGLGAFQDEDVAYYSAGAWSVWFDGTGKGLTANNQDLDAIDVP